MTDPYRMVGQELNARMREYAERIASGVEIIPEEFGARCVALERRGLSHEVAIMLWQGGNLSLLREIEAATDDQLRAVNRAATMAGGERP